MRRIHLATLQHTTAIAGASRDFRGQCAQRKTKERNDTLLGAEGYAHLFKQMWIRLNSVL
jgi:hypothetical protein